MANSQNPNPPTFRPSKKKPGTFVPNVDESQEQKQGQRGAEPGGADKVEIGDPVRESDRVTRASNPRTAPGGARQGARGQGETGEDEDLPDDAGGVEGSHSERH